METWTGFLRIQVMMAYNQCLGITLMQLFNQFSQRSLLCFRPGVFRRCSAIIQSAYVAYTYTVAVVVLAMCSNQLFRAEAQKATLRKLIEQLHQRYPKALIVGHHDLNPQKACPCFHVTAEYIDLQP
jgi:hypothetical protein